MNIYTPKNNLSFTFTFTLFFSFSLSFFLASLPVELFYDRLNYIEYASNSSLYFERYLSKGYLSVIFNEPLWLFINITLSSFLTPEMTVRGIIFSSSFLLFINILLKDKKNLLFLVILILFPLVMKNYIVHLRQGLALSIFICGYMSQNKILRTLMILLSPLVHLSFLFVVLFYYFSLYMNRWNISTSLKIASSISFVSFIASITLFMANVLGARQFGRVAEMNIGGSGAGFLFWLFVLFVFLLQSNDFKDKYLFQILMITFYLAGYFYLPFTARIFESGIVVVALSFIFLSEPYRLLLMVLFSLYGALIWISRFNEPYFGFV